MSPRGIALARTFAAAFGALAEHQKRNPGEAGVLVDQVASHLRSAWPMEAVVPAYVPPTAEDQAELSKLRDEVIAMRPVFVAAIAWRETNDGDRDHAALANVIDAAEGASGGLRLQRLSESAGDDEDIVSLRKAGGL